MKLYTIQTGYFKLDGGAMFGVVPFSIWKHLNAPDENNMCSWAMRSLLIEDGDRLILIDCGIGNKQSEKFFGYYYLHGDDTIDASLKQHGFSREDITDVVLTHLHFDHCGGAIEWNDEKTGYKPAFKNARYWSNKDHWKWATEPNPREKASFLKENILPIEEAGRLQHVSIDGRITKNAFDNIDMLFVNGHTDKQMLPMIHYKGKTIVFAADLLPSVAHIPIPYVMAYDTRPLLTMYEKKQFISEAFENEFILFFEHDPVVECCTLKQTEKGIRSGDEFLLSDI